MAAKRNLNNSTNEDKTGTSKSSGKARKKDQTIEDKQRELSERCKTDIEKELKSKRRRSSIILFAIGVLMALFTIIGFIGSLNRAEGDSLNLLDMIYSFLCGMFGFTVFFTGPILIYVAVLIATDKSRTSILTKILQLSGGIVILSTAIQIFFCLLYTSPSPRDGLLSRMPSSA